MPESSEHRKLKNVISLSLVDWTGASLTEFDSSGHELDAYAVTSDGVSIYIEIIWSASRTNFYRDMNLIQQSDADIKIVVVSSKIYLNEDLQREFSKIAISQRRFGFQMHGQLINGNKLLEDPEYLNGEFKQLILNLVEKIRLYGKVSIEREVVLPSIPVVKKMSEYLYSNLFPVKSYPETIFSGPTNVRLDKDVFDVLGNDVNGHPFLLKEKRLFCFDDLSTKSLFAPLISANVLSKYSSKSWIDDEYKKRDLIRLFNFALRSYCFQRGLFYDKRHRRYMCLLIKGRDNLFQWKSRTKVATRAVAKAIHSKQGELLYYRHYTARLGFILLENNLFLKIEPSITLTSDGFQQLDKKQLARKLGRSIRRQYNYNYLNFTRFWAKYLSKRSLVLSIRTGDDFISVETNPAGATMLVGIASDQG